MYLFKTSFDVECHIILRLFKMPLDINMLFFIEYFITNILSKYFGK